MKKTYVTKMPNHIGAFLKASKCFYELGINITRVSYNKAVDSHTLFIEVEGEELQLEKASQKLKQIGYLSLQRKAGRRFALCGGEPADAQLQKAGASYRCRSLYDHYPCGRNAGRGL